MKEQQLLKIRSILKTLNLIEQEINQLRLEVNNLRLNILKEK